MEHEEKNKGIAPCDSSLGCHHAEQISQKAADEAVKKVFYRLGVDVNKPESVEAFREDLRFGGKLRMIAERSIIAFIGVVTTAIAVFVVEAIRARL